MTASRLRLGGLMLLGVGLAAALFFSCYERREVEAPVARSREAIRNPYLALGRLLERMGHTVVEIEGAGRLGTLPPPDATLVLPVPRRTLRGPRSARLLEWVAGGGHLIVTSHAPWDDPQREADPLLDPLGFRLLERNLPPTPFDGDPPCACPPSNGGEPGADGEGETAEEPPAAPPDFRQAIEAALRPPVAWDDVEASWPGRDAPLAARFDRRFRWGDSQARARWALAGVRGVHVLQVAYGAGTITALSDDLFLRNEHIGHGDHGELALRLARSEHRGAPHRGAPVWIVVSEEWPGLAAALRQHAAPALASALVLTLAWLASVVPRFGPLRPGPEPERRRWMEHVEAVGRFHWRDERGRVLLAGVRGSLLRELERRRPDWARLEAGGRTRRLAAATGLAPERVAHALAPEAAPRSEAAFVSLVADLERIRASL